MATIKDVAKLAQVSVSTVSRVANDSASVNKEKADRVKAAMTELGYYPSALARALVSKRSDCVGLLVGELGAPFFAQIMQGVDKVMMENGRHIFITSGYHSEKQEREGVEFLLSRQVDALILHAKALSDEYLISVFNRGLPVYFLNRVVPGYEKYSIWLDNEQGAYMATRHLISKGHQQIAYIGTNIVGEDGEDREAGYRRALTEAGITVNDAHHAFAFPDENGGHYAVAELLHNNPEVTAIFCYNDAMAAGALTFMQDCGKKVPEDISLVGFDNVILARLLQPRLTTIHYPVEEMSALAATRIINDLDGNPNPENQSLRFSPRLVERHSVKAIER